MKTIEIYLDADDAKTYSEVLNDLVSKYLPEDFAEFTELTEKEEDEDRWNEIVTEALEKCWEQVDEEFLSNGFTFDHDESRDDLEARIFYTFEKELSDEEFEKIISEIERDLPYFLTIKQ